MVYINRRVLIVNWKHFITISKITNKIIQYF